MQTIEVDGVKFTAQRTMLGLRLFLTGLEGKAEITVSEQWLRNNLVILDKVRKASKFIPGSASVAVYAEKLRKALEEELAVTPAVGSEERH